VTLVFTKSPALLSRIIMWMQKDGECSHVGIGTELHGVPVVVHADWKVRITPRSHFLLGRTVVEEHRIKKDVTRGFQHAVSMVDTDYDIIGALGFGVVALAWKWLGRKVKNPLASAKAVVCSEFAALIGAYGEVESLKDLDSESLLPDPLLELCRASASDFEFVPQEGV